MKLVILLSFVATVAVFAAPSAPAGLEEKLRALQEQLYSLEKENGVDVKQKEQPAAADTFLGFVPQKRMVAWQPMKRSMINEDSRAPLLHAIEARLAEVLRAGERLGVNPEEVLADLRARNQFQ
ncbi:Peptide P4 [Caenorhabditis elegans]|uniref:Neuropeptide-like peptides nlp-40 n=2 Tax=Caenorhabditis elegans TaxID=6239 RepID=NLP40_CAEEL|nr:Peptide P4 [Caenorhabditis elegans]Q9N4D8.1 RecName: Full=Neuropeptide-like peptides nlp-40; Contains: RecName: Full=Peptide P1; AltName: Full=P1; Contains: RecName: Full=Peptide P2; AltName: Full=P2; Contains: RecName: Full=Peptide P3; AltName: Full=P3; Contains: RecName: Full=Peptide P4; AltName: Full=P4; Flags: Precursor [Caenorhabditis elegans]CCD68262.1 Peptide P4 [Caenorhabditis elegans]|eukprot:NP_490661.1 Peptide P4 [Caenorhabditis elegans]